MSDQQKTRVHTHCRRCRVPLTQHTAHCTERGCPWCRPCRERSTRCTPHQLRDRFAGRNARAAALAAEVEDLLPPGQAKRLADCVTKTRFTTKQLAANAALVLSWTGVHVKPYPCDWCGDWHHQHDDRRSA